MTPPREKGYKPPTQLCSPRDILARIDREQERVHDENEWARPDPKAEAVAKQAERELRPSIPATTVRFVLPSNADPLEPLDPARRAAFAERLRDFAAQAAVPEETSGAEDHDGLTANLCTACRGSCCRSGGDHAYITEETIARVLKEHPEWTAAQAVDAYLAHLPAEIYRDSCVYHSATGCGLPRTLRAATCNRHLCGKIQNLRATAPLGQPILAVMFDAGRWTRTALVDESGLKILAE